MEPITKAYAVVSEDEKSYVVEPQEGNKDATYDYQPLPSKGNHLRLLKLMPGHIGRLDCSIDCHVIEAPERPPFKALSYSWRNPKYDGMAIAGRRIHEKDDLRSSYDVVHPLWCNGKRVLISTSLRDALRVLRHDTEPVWIWVDALCINQRDLDERASQVLLMQRIYHVAAEVCMWLGVEDEFTRPAFDMFTAIQSLGTRKAAVTPADLYEFNVRERLGIPKFPGRQWEAIVRLLERPYFRRIWILQEMIASGLSARVYCGTGNSIAWTVLLESVLFLGDAGWAQPIDSFYGANNYFSFILTVHNLRIAWMQGATSEEGRLRIRRLAGATRRFEATDPRDKVFALVGIINDFGHRDLFGADRPGGSLNQPVKVTDNVVNMTFHFDEKGRSQEDIALEILQRHQDSKIRSLYDALQDFFQGNMRVAEVILDANEDGDVEIEDFAEKAQKAVQAITNIQDFEKYFQSISLDHKRVGDFAVKALGMFDRGLMMYAGLIGKYADTPDFARVCNLPQLREEVKRFREGNEWFLESLEHPPKPRPSGEGVGMGKTPIVIGDRKHLDSLDYKIEVHRLYPDWAWSAAGWVVPMYDRPTEQVYTEFAVKCLQDDDSLDLLSSVEDRSERSIGGLPSWVPDFSVAMIRSPLSARHRDGSDVYSAAGFTSCSTRWDVSDRGLLVVQGYEVDKIRLLASPESAENKIVSQPQEWAALISSLPEDYPTGGSVSEALWRTLIGDYARSDQGLVSPAPPEYEDYYASFQRLLRLNKAMEKINPTEAVQVYAAHKIDSRSLPKLLAEKDKMLASMSRIMIGRRLFVTEGGLIGAGPLSAQPGDDVYILSGGSVPHVLRHASESGRSQQFGFVGECYLHGIMKGAVTQRKDFSWAEVELR